MATNTISQRIALEGAEDLARKFAELAKAGEQAFAQIADAASKPVGDQQQFDKTEKAIAGLAEAGSTLSRQFGELAKSAGAVGGEINEAGKAAGQSSQQYEEHAKTVTKATEAHKSFTLETVNAVTGIANNVAQLGELTAKYALYAAALLEAKRRKDALIETFEKLALRAATSGRGLVAATGALGPLAVAAGATAIAVTGLVTAFAALEKITTALAITNQKLSRELDLFAQKTGVSFEALQQGKALFELVGLSAEKYITVIEKMGALKGVEDQAAKLKGLADEARDAAKGIADAQQAVFDAQRKLTAPGAGAETESAHNQAIRERLALYAQLDAAEKQLTAAREKAAEVQKKQAEAVANDLGKVAGEIKAIAKEFKDVGFGDLVKDETIVKALANSMNELKQKGELAGKFIVDFLTNLAKTDRLKAINIGEKFGITEKDIDRLVRTNGQLETTDEIVKRLEGAGAFFSEGARQAFNEMQTSIEKSEAASVRFNQAWASNIVPRVAAEFSNFFRDVGTGFKLLGAIVVEEFNKVLNAFGGVFAFIGGQIAGAAGVIAGEAAKVFAPILAVAVKVGQAFGSVFAIIIAEAVKVAQAFGGVFAFIGGQIAGAAGVIAGEAAKVFAPIIEESVKVGQAVVAVFTDIGRLLGAIMSGLDTIFAQPAQFFQQLWEVTINWFGQKLAEAGGLLGAFVTTPISGAWEWVKQVWDGIISWIGQKIEEGRQSITALVTTPIDAAWAWIKDTFDAVMAWLGQKVEEGKQLVISFVTSPVTGAWDWLKGSFQAVLDWIAQKWAALKSNLGLGGGGAGLPGGASGGQFARGGLLGGRGSGTSDSNLAWVSRGEYIIPARIVAQPGVLAFLEALRRTGRLRGFAGGGLVPAFAEGGKASGGSNLASALKQVGDLLVNAAETASRNAVAMDETLKRIAFTTFEALNAASFEVRDMANNVDQTLARAVDILKNLIGSAGGNASGGLLGGRGSGTSDSNLAWVSRGEYIIPARAVAQPGVLTFLELLRRSGGNLGRAIAALGHFASGGLVGIPRYADGGPTLDAPGRGDIGQMADALANIAQSVGNALIQLIMKIATGVKKIADDIIEKSGGFSNQLVKVADDITKSFFDIAVDLVGFANGIIKDLGSVVNGLVSSTQQTLDRARGRASGGLLGGRGTGTSDSNLAWVSRGEYITPANAVRQPGVLAFLEALRRSGGNLRAVLDGMGRYALGGLIPNSIPALAGGGLGGMSNVTIQFPGLPAIGGLRASSDVVDELRKAAVLAQVRSGGRKPSRYS